MSTATTNSDSKRPRLDSWGSNSSPLSHEVHHSQSQNLPQSSSHVSSASTTGLGCGGGTAWGIKTSPQPIQHTLSHARSYSVHTFQSPHQPALVEPSAPTPSSAGSTPHARNPTDQQHLRSFSVSSNSSTSAGLASHYPQEPPNYYPQQVQTQQSIAPATTAALLESISPTTLAPGPSSTMPGGYSNLGPPGIMAHQQHMNGASPVSAQGMNAVTTYPPRRKAIRAAQACDACRARKAKCDEGRPSCGFCRETQIPCVYREVPPPKQDRTLLQILERLGRVETLLGSLAPKQVTATDGASAQVVPPFYPSSQDSRGGGDPGSNSLSTSTRHQPPACLTEVPLEVDGQLAIPVQHTTAAHKLMWWPSIRKLIDSEFLENESYVMQEEEKRGPLRIYGRGESMDSPESMLEDMDDIDSWYAWDSGRGVDEVIDGARRANGGSPMEECPPDGGDYVGSRRKPSKPPGSGLTTGGGLKLDHQTVIGLLDSYLANMHILHPIVDKAGLTRLAFMFSDRIATASATSPSTPLSTTSSGPAVGLGLGGVAEMGNDSQGFRRRGSATTKRKRSLSGIASFHMTSQGTAHAHVPVPQRIPRTLHSTLVLLVLALGAICLHRGPVPGPLPPPPRSPDYRTATTTPPHSDASPPYHPFPQQQPGPPSGRQHGRELRNIDVIPGLAYFGKAMEILGVLAGGNELENVQICLLAGLYWGQLGRVLDSWKWINYACMGCQILVRMRLQSEKSELRRDLILRAFWTCLQLESDILAELDLPPSGISRLEDSMPLPRMIEPADTATMDKMCMYYLAQAALRKLLNRAHTTLYKDDRMRLDSPRSLAMARELDYQLEQWKLHLPEPLRWEESEPPSGDINAARLRAKYFGARYIIHRPFVYHVIHGGGGLLSASSPTNSEASRSPSASTPGGFSAARRVSVMGDERAELAPVSLEMSCRKCLESAIQSTTAFHAFSPDDNRPIITNVFGTAHAQFGNLLVLQAAYQCPALRPMMQPHTLGILLSKTINWLRTLSPISSALRHDARILENAASKVDLGRY